MARAVTVVRVFTRGEDGGNHLGVVSSLVDLDDAGMQAIATHLGYSETIFIDWPADSIPFVRIFTPAEELPFAGHPLVGAAWCLTRMGPGKMDRLRYRSGTANIRTDEGLTWIDVDMTGEVADAGDALAFASRAGITGIEAVHRLMMPLEYVLVRLASPRAVSEVVPAMDVLAEKFGTFVYSRGGGGVRARFFAPSSAVDEDPATGSAAVALATLLAHEGETDGRLSVDQGEETGFPSRIELAWSDGRAAIGGTVVRDGVRMVDEDDL
ncbi:MAG: PhzF family phenazine biosynthesis isomerase [Acidimicrobiia bacterium]|nr:PhzF family phenazine biosynthesis isomerase [Acidimicrobiia bacterium]